MKQTRLYFVANVRLPSERAHSVQVMQMCSAFVASGFVVELVVPRRNLENSPQDENVFEYYQVPPNFKITYVRHLDWFYLSNKFRFLAIPLFWLQDISFAWAASRMLKKIPGVVYTRSKFMAWFCASSLLANKCVFESHDSLQPNYLDVILAQKLKMIICTNESVTSQWRKLHAQVEVVPNGVANTFFKPIPKSKARKALALDQKATIILYAGSFFPHKGIDTFVQAAVFSEHQFYAIGYNPLSLDQARFVKQAQHIINLTMVPHQPFKDMLHWLKAADVLVIPNSSMHQLSQSDTSPLKLFEYLAVKRLVVAADVPAIRNLIDDTAVWFFKSDSPKALVKAINQALAASETTKNLKLKSAQKAASIQTWNLRSQRIISLMLKKGISLEVDSTTQN